MEKEKKREPARVPIAPARLRPFFLRMKLEPMKTLDATASINPFPLSVSIPYINVNVKLTLNLIYRIRKTIEVNRGLSLNNPISIDQNQSAIINPAEMKKFETRVVVADDIREDDERESNKWFDATRTHDDFCDFALQKKIQKNQN